MSQLKEFNPSYAPAFQAVPPPQILNGVAAQPLAILQRRLVQKGNEPATQVLVHWSTLPEDCATWEDYEVLRRRFPDATIWKDEQTQGGASVMTSVHHILKPDTEDLVHDGMSQIVDQVAEGDE